MCRQVLGRMLTFDCEVAHAFYCFTEWALNDIEDIKPIRQAVAAVFID